MLDDYVNAAEAARLLGQHEKTIRQWIHEGKLKATHPGRDYRIPRTEIQRFLKAAHHPAGSLADVEARMRQHYDAQLAALEARLEALEAWREETERKRAKLTERAPAPPQPHTEPEPGSRAMLPRLRAAFERRSNPDLADTAKRPAVPPSAPPAGDLPDIRTLADTLHRSDAPGTPVLRNVAPPEDGQTATSLPVAWRPPPRVHTLIARDIVRYHGGTENTVRRWELPLDYAEALRFVASAYIRLGYRVSNERLHECERTDCPCHQILPDV